MALRRCRAVASTTEISSPRQKYAFVGLRRNAEFSRTETHFRESLLLLLLLLLAKFGVVL